MASGGPKEPEVKSGKRKAREEEEGKHLRNELYLLIIISRNVFCGATSPRRLVGILAPHLGAPFASLRALRPP